jgi:hypothetical protein
MTEWLVADWTQYFPQKDGTSIAYLLSLGRDGRYVHTISQPDGSAVVTQGAWDHDPAQDILRFQPDAGQEPPRGEATWKIWGRGPNLDEPAWMTGDSCWPLKPVALTLAYRFTLNARPFGSGLPREPAPPPGRLTYLVDPNFGELHWHEWGYQWVGRLPVGGREVRIELKPYVDCSVGAKGGGPTAEAQRAILEMWRGLQARLPEAEPQWRRRATEDVASAAEDFFAYSGLSQDQFSENLKLEYITLWDWMGTFHYSSELDEITIQFGLDLAYQGVENG